MPSSGDKGNRHGARIDRYPDVCPICHYSVTPELFLNVLNTSKDKDEEKILESIFRCSRYTCQRLFIAYYNYPANGTSVWTFESVQPNTVKPREFEVEITTISPEFSNIYNQAKQAEENQLNHIAGMGYRKSLEFLIKDYLINFKNEDRTEIEGKLLGKCIKENVTDANIRSVAERAAWLGNDETHYVRKWVTKDIKDLKALIDVSIYWITSEIKTRDILSEMN